MKLLIAYGSRGKFFHLREFADELEKLDVKVRLVHDSEYSQGFPSKNISEWINGDKKFKQLIKEFEPNAIFVDRQSHFALQSVKSEIPTFVLLRGHYWQEYFWGMRTLGKSWKKRIIIWLRNRISEKVFQEATAILPICSYLEGVVKERYPNQNTGVFLEGINSSRWFKTDKMELEHPCVGLVQDANWWGKTKELLEMEKVIEKMPDVNFYWVGDGEYREEITSKLEKFKNFRWLGRLEYPKEIRIFLETIDVYALITGMDLAPLTLKEAQLMKKPVIATDVGGDKEMMINGETGFLVRQGNSDDIIKKISLILENDEMAKKMGENGAEFIKNQFNWEFVAKNFLKIIEPYLRQK
tara:strand:+ start:1180 stop:2244 length:1065 start_codon:yes stop_codon:yes gene_type:complete